MVTAVEVKIGVIATFRRDKQEMWACMMGHQGNIMALDFSPDGTMLASGSIDQTARVWNVESGAEHKSFPGHAGFVRAVRKSSLQLTHRRA